MVEDNGYTQRALECLDDAAEAEDHPDHSDIKRELAQVYATLAVAHELAALRRTVERLGGG
jgi:hypothetical protein